MNKHEHDFISSFFRFKYLEITKKFKQESSKK